MTEIPLAVSRFRVRWKGGPTETEEAGIEKVGPGTFRIFHNVNEDLRYEETYGPRPEHQLGGKTGALEDLNCLYREFWQYLDSDEVELVEAVPTKHKAVCRTARTFPRTVHRVRPYIRHRL